MGGERDIKDLRDPKVGAGSRSARWVRRAYGSWRGRSLAGAEAAGVPDTELALGFRVAFFGGGGEAGNRGEGVGGAEGVDGSEEGGGGQGWKDVSH